MGRVHTVRSRTSAQFPHELERTNRKITGLLTYEHSTIPTGSKKREKDDLKKKGKVVLISRHKSVATGSVGTFSSGGGRTGQQVKDWPNLRAQLVVLAVDPSLGKGELHAPALDSWHPDYWKTGLIGWCNSSSISLLKWSMQISFFFNTLTSSSEVYHLTVSFFSSLKIKECNATKKL